MMNWSKYAETKNSFGLGVVEKIKGEIVNTLKAQEEALDAIIHTNKIKLESFAVFASSMGCSFSYSLIFLEQTIPTIKVDFHLPEQRTCSNQNNWQGILGCARHFACSTLWCMLQENWQKLLRGSVVHISKWVEEPSGSFTQSLF